MKTLNLLFIALFLSSANYSQDSIMPILHEMFTAQDLNYDLNFIKNKAIHKKGSNDGLLFVDKEKFYNLFDSIANVINQKENMSRLDFYFLTAPLVQILQDDVSFYSLVGKYAYNSDKEEYLPFAEKTVLPLSVDVFQDSVYVTSKNSDLYKARVISINDIPANKMVSDICKYTSFRKYRYYSRHQYASSELYYNSVILHLLFGYQDEVEIKYTPYNSDEILTSQLDLLPIGDASFYNIVKQEADSLPWYSLNFKKNNAIFRINSMPHGELNLELINNIFKEIYEKKSESLIIDISGCTWSYDNFWLVLLNYLYEGDLSLYENLKKPQNLSKYSKKIINNNDYILGKFSDITEDYKFKGEIYLITGSSTTSAAVRFADILRYNKIINKSFGEETLTKTTQYDFFNRYYLPATGLTLGLSTALYYALDKNLDTHGFIPDVEIKPKNKNEYWKNHDNVLMIDEVINLLESENTK